MSSQTAQSRPGDGPPDPAARILAAGLQEVGDDPRAFLRVFAEQEAKDRRTPRRSIGLCSLSIRQPSEVLDRVQRAGRAITDLLIGPQPGMASRILGTFIGKGLFARPRPEHSLVLLCLDEVPSWLGALLVGATHDFPTRCCIAAAWDGQRLHPPQPLSQRGLALVDWAEALFSATGAAGTTDP